MILAVDENALWEQGIHRTSWDEFLARFGTSAWRQRLTASVRSAVENLKNASCLTIYFDGGFVTIKEVPSYLRLLG